jgi:hypothetical protein
LLAGWGTVAHMHGQESPYFHEAFCMPGCANVVVALTLLLGVAVTLRSALRAVRKAPD